MRALILAAGRGTRLGSLTDTLPKPLLPAAGRPLLGWIIAHLVACGVRRVAVNLSYRGEAIAAWLGDGRHLGLDEVVLSPEAEPLGTAGALRPLAAWLAQSPFLIHYGDVVTDHPLADLMADQQRHAALATLLVHRRSGSNSILQVADDGTITAFRERPPQAEIDQAGTCWVNSGICACSPALLDHIPAGGTPDLARDVFAVQASGGLLRAMPLVGERVAVDSVERLQRLTGMLEKGQLRLAGTPRAFSDR